MDQSLNAHVKIDTVSDTVRIDVLGTLTQASRPTLMQTIQRIRQMGITSHVRVELGAPPLSSRPRWPDSATTLTRSTPAPYTVTSRARADRKRCLAGTFRSHF